MPSHLSLVLLASVAGLSAFPSAIGTDTSIPKLCSEISSLYPIPSVASSFCSSYLGIKTSTVTSTQTVATATTTVTATNATTTTLFLPGNPPPAANKRRSEQDAAHAAPPALLSSACSCLSLTTPSVTAVTTIPIISTLTTSTITETVYPCATGADGTLPSPGPGYGKAQNTAGLGLSNDIYYLDTASGANASACCNTCFFELANCVQAWWYFYEGCVVSQATAEEGTGAGVSAACPSGPFANLTYVPDYDQAFRSTGDIAGPCGVEYTNF